MLISFALFSELRLAQLALDANNSPAWEVPEQERRPSTKMPLFVKARPVVRSLNHTEVIIKFLIFNLKTSFYKIYKIFAFIVGEMWLLLYCICKQGFTTSSISQRQSTKFKLFVGMHK